ncbi:response regulator [Streptomyces sp. JJ36]|nr:response regulator [Streptomyces sp. JJ36]
MSGRVLVVDDNKVIRHLIKVNLELEGFEVVTADDGAECLEIIHRVRPDVITLDVVMPRLDGLRTVDRLRADPRTRDIPVALVSACTPDEIEARQPAEAAAVEAIVAKPFEPAALVRTVRRLVRDGRRQGTRGPGRGAPHGVAPQGRRHGRSTAGGTQHAAGRGTGAGAGRGTGGVPGVPGAPGAVGGTGQSGARGAGEARESPGLPGAAAQPEAADGEQWGAGSSAACS